MTQAVALYLRRLEIGLKKADLDVSHFRVLMCLRNDRAVSVSEIATIAVAKLSTITKIVQRMQADGLVSCDTSRTDARVTEVSLTPIGRTMKQTAWEVANRVYDEAFADIPAPKEFDLNQTLRLLVGNLRR